MPKDKTTIQTINPASLEVIKTYEVMSGKQVDLIINSTQKAFLKWSNLSLEKRISSITKFAQILTKNKEKVAILMANEMGKNIKEARAEVEKSINTIGALTENALNVLAEKKIDGNSQIQFAPLGIIFGIMPWNFPLWQVIRFCVPALLVGNGIILKHASATSGTSILIEQLFSKALPKNVFKSIIFDAKNIEFVVKNPHISAISLTGSVEAGRSVAQIAGKYLKKCVLELGGSDPYLIFPDANLQKAAQICTRARLINAGQSCVAAKRFIVHKTIYKKFIELFKIEMAKKTFGAPLDETRDFGSLCSTKARNDVNQMVLEAVKNGAKVILGGVVPKQKGAFYPPTIIEIDEKNPIFQKEVFGPVALVIKATSEKQMIDLANNSQFGLGSSIFLNDIKKAKEISKQVNAGMCFINDFVKSDVNLPFGGVKQSGYGRELSSFGFLEFCNIKTIVAKKI